MGDITFDDGFLGELEKSLRRGSHVLISARHRQSLGKEFDRLQQQGNIEVLEPWTNPATGRPTAISHDKLRAIVKETLPIEIAGDAIQFQINRTPQGWLVELINNQGIIKKPDEAAAIAPNALARVSLKPLVSCSAATNGDPADLTQRRASSNWNSVPARSST